MGFVVFAIGAAIGVYVLSRKPEWARSLGETVGAIRPWQALAVAGVVLAFTMKQSAIVVFAALALAVVLFGLEWLREFGFLMRLNDDAFPGRNDKLIWAILMIVLPPVGLWQFRSYRQAHWPEAKPEKVAVFEDLF